MPASWLLASLALASLDGSAAQTPSPPVETTRRPNAGRIRMVPESKLIIGSDVDPALVELWNWSIQESVELHWLVTFGLGSFLREDGRESAVSDTAGRLVITLSATARPDGGATVRLEAEQGAAYWSDQFEVPAGTRPEFPDYPSETSAQRQRPNPFGDNIVVLTQRMYRAMAFD